MILFGSHTRGRPRRTATLDFLVVEPEVEDDGGEAVRLMGVLRDLRRLSWEGRAGLAAAVVAAGGGWAAAALLRLEAPRHCWQLPRVARYACNCQPTCLPGICKRH